MKAKTPRSKCTQRSSEYLKDEHIQQVLKELERDLKHIASRISRPYYDDDQDLIQEALLHIWLKRDRYNEDIASIRTWCLKIAKRKLYNLATTGFRQKRFAQDSEGKVTFPVEFKDELAGNCRNAGEDNIRTQEIITRTEAKLHKLSKQVFLTLLQPPEDLITQVRSDRIQTMRERHVGMREKIPFAFNITNESLANYLKVPYSSIVKAKDEIYYAMSKAIDE